MQGGWRTRRGKHSVFHAGFCGFDGQHGYENGYSWMGDLMRSGWFPLSDIGEWPLVVFMLWRARATDPRFAIAQYCEGDMAIELFDSKQAASNGLRELSRAHPACPRV